MVVLACSIVSKTGKGKQKQGRARETDKRWRRKKKSNRWGGAFFSIDGSMRLSRLSLPFVSLPFSRSRFLVVLSSGTQHQHQSHPLLLSSRLPPVRGDDARAHRGPARGVPQARRRRRLDGRGQAAHLRGDRHGPVPVPAARGENENGEEEHGDWNR